MCRQLSFITLPADGDAIYHGNQYAYLERRDSFARRTISVSNDVWRPPPRGFQEAGRGRAGSSFPDEATPAGPPNVNQSRRVAIPIISVSISSWDAAPVRWPIICRSNFRGETCIPARSRYGVCPPEFRLRFHSGHQTQASLITHSSRSFIRLDEHGFPTGTRPRARAGNSGTVISRDRPPGKERRDVVDARFSMTIISTRPARREPSAATVPRSFRRSSRYVLSPVHIIGCRAI